MTDVWVVSFLQRDLFVIAGVFSSYDKANEASQIIRENRMSVEMHKFVIDNVDVIDYFFKEPVDYTNLGQYESKQK